MEPLLTTAIPGLPPPRRGKVREVYDLGDSVLIVATDRLSAFDVVLPTGIPDKGRILNQMSAFWFERLGHVCPNHVLTTDDDAIAAKIGVKDPHLAGRCTLARKADTVPIECVARAYLTGSLYKEYVRSGNSLHGLLMPLGLRDGDRLPAPLFTPATKAAEGHDENISFQQVVDRVGRTTADLLRDWTITLFSHAAKHAAACGLILADTKFEFGWSDGELIWIDEALTPDSSRYWEASQWRPGGPQPSFDKQFVRDYLETLDWNKQAPGPTLPDDVVQRTRAKYVEAFERITGRTFV
ncbi:MAG TPA: phosphoribosylaminoimidazolesuccinocarboxamide synthase [Fimbriimonadaceae bacterium]|nr:phosphoribosylaminoimidazolesuccinocarboxamide synthase [Fimbriimonadaceae bacterium]